MGARVSAWSESPEPVVRWLIWHHLYGWLSKAEFTLGLALALTHAMGLVKHDQTIEHLVDLASRYRPCAACLTACERDPRFTEAGYCVPNHAHLAVGGIAILKARQRMAEILRIVPGSSLVVCPSDKDLAAPEIAAGLEDSFGGGGYTATAAIRPVADGVGPRLVGARRPRIGLRIARQRRHPGLARPAAPQLSDATTSSPTPSLRAVDLPMPEIDASAHPSRPARPAPDQRAGGVGQQGL